jgi:hypothetical protein
MWNVLMHSDKSLAAMKWFFNVFNGLKLPAKEVFWRERFERVTRGLLDNFLIFYQILKIKKNI